MLPQWHIFNKYLLRLLEVKYFFPALQSCDITKTWLTSFSDGPRATLIMMFWEQHSHGVIRTCQLINQYWNLLLSTKKMSLCQALMSDDDSILKTIPVSHTHTRAHTHTHTHTHHPHSISPFSFRSYNAGSAPNHCVLSGKVNYNALRGSIMPPEAMIWLLRPWRKNQIRLLWSAPQMTFRSCPQACSDE